MSLMDGKNPKGYAIKAWMNAPRFCLWSGCGAEEGRVPGWNRLPAYLVSGQSMEGRPCLSSKSNPHMKGLCNFQRMRICLNVCAYTNWCRGSAGPDSLEPPRILLIGNQVLCPESGTEPNAIHNMTVPWHPFYNMKVQKITSSAMQNSVYPFTAFTWRGNFVMGIGMGVQEWARELGFASSFVLIVQMWWCRLFKSSFHQKFSHNSAKFQPPVQNSEIPSSPILKSILYVCLHVGMYVCTCIYMHAWMHVRTYVRTDQPTRRAGKQAGRQTNGHWQPLMKCPRGI